MIGLYIAVSACSGHSQKPSKTLKKPQEYSQDYGTFYGIMPCMGTIRKRGNGYEVGVCVNGVRLYETLPTKATATAWMIQAESELRTSGRPDMTVGAAMRRYSDEVAPSHKGGDWEVIRLRALGKMPLAKIKLGRLKNSDTSSCRHFPLKLGNGNSG